MNDDAAPPLPAASTPRARHRRFVMGVSLAVALYGVGYLVWYLQTPLGRAPQLDGAENIALAEKIVSGTLPHESFYRAMLYPAVLSIPLKLGLPEDNLPAFASIFGLLCHFLITLGVARLAGRVWVGSREKWAALLAAVFWGLNPVALFYAVDVLDTVPSLALAVWALVWWSRPGARTHDAWVGGVLLGLAVAARPHFLPLVFIAPLARAWLAGRWRPRLPDAIAWAGAVAVLIGMGGVQKYWSGEFAILPTQGAYNFYAANKPGANGKYYAQQMLFAEITPGENPARMESEALFAKATGKTPPISIKEMNAYWRRQTWSSLTANPREWLRLELKKTYYFLNDFEQYNNKTYAWHKAESPFLNENFLGWGILLVLSAGILALRGRGQGTLATDFNCPIVAGVMLVFCVYLAGALLYYASGRFRLPLMPWLCVLAGGWMTWPGWAAAQRSKILAACLIMPLTALVVFSDFYKVRDQSTFIQDELLSANAAAQAGEDARAYALAERVLTRDFTRSDARRIAVMSYYNLSVENAAGYNSIAGWKLELEQVSGLESQDAGLALVAGVADWKNGDPVSAEKIWLSGVAHFGPDSAPARALAAMNYLRGKPSPLSLPPDFSMVEYLKRSPDLTP